MWSLPGNRGGKDRFTCVDGPEFDAHLIDFDEILSRLGGFKDTEVAKLHDVEVKQEDAEHSHGVSDRNEPWRQELRQKVAGKERTSIERVHMPETAPEERIRANVSR